jgi:hypothetical protein
MAKGLCTNCSVVLAEDNCSPSTLKNGSGFCRFCAAARQKMNRKERANSLIKPSIKCHNKRCGLILTVENCSPSILKNGCGARCRKCDNNYKKSRSWYKDRWYTPKGRHSVVKQKIKNERVPKTDLLWSFNFYKEIIRDMICHYCEGPLNATAMGLDAKNNLLGHTCYNVVPCCRVCNRKKCNDWSYEDMMLLSPILREIRKRKEADQLQKSHPAENRLVYNAVQNQLAIAA